MALINPTLPTIGQPNSTEDVDLLSALSAIIAAINGGLDTANLATAAGVTETQLAAALTTRLGLGSTGRGKSLIAPTESRSNTAYGLLTTPDKVTVTLPSGGLILLAYQATWQESVAGAARAAIFIGSTQLSVAGTAGVVPVAAATGCATAAHDLPLFSTPTGLVSNANQNVYPGDATTGQIVGFHRAGSAFANTQEVNGTPTSLTELSVGGPLAVFAAAGTYDMSVQFKASSGSVAVRDRKLWVWTMGF